MKHLMMSVAGTALMLVSVAVMTAPDRADAQTRTLRLAEFGPDRGARAEGLAWMAREVNERSDGALSIDIIWGGALVGAADAAQAVSDGVADMGSIVPVYAPGQLVVYEVADTTQLPDEWVGMMATYELMTTHPAALAEAEQFNIRYFGNYTTGPTQLLTRDRPVSTGDDLSGMTIRATGPFVPAVEQFDAATVSVAQPAVYEALSSGAVDGSTTYYYVVDGYKQYEVANYMTSLNLGQTLGFGIIMNRDSYNSLDSEHQELMDELGRDFTEEMARIMHESRTETKARLAEGIDGYKIEMVEPAEEFRAQMIAAAEADGDKWIDKAEAKGLDADGIRADFNTLIERYQAEADANGYPWDR